MPEIPVHIERYQQFLAVGIIVGLIVVSVYFHERLPWGDTVKDLFPTDTRAALIAHIALIVIGLTSLALALTGERFVWALDALATRLGTAEVHGSMWSGILRCTTPDGRSYFLYYYPGRKHTRAYYELWLELLTELEDLDSGEHITAIDHLESIAVRPGDGGGPARLVAHLNESATSTDALPRTLDALFELRDHRRQ
ncbi:MAG: hypothetical protein QF415_10610 [Candidatus Undinarchaeales archaeon]|jgi:hypothetical protein|nr:hypothetical protein [Candidatus Undinarchaeales archaeon]MDP7494221.1 hypothetical protein [Candidatus Undinarchaeales archaeon]